MKEFLRTISDMIGQLDGQGTFEADTILKMTESYLRLSAEERQSSIRILNDLLKEDYRAYFYVMSALMRESKDARMLPCFKERLADGHYPLWERYSNMHQLKMMLFRQQMQYREERQEYQICREIYEGIQKELQNRIGAHYPYLSYDDRKKTIIIIVMQILSPEHAPTKKVIDFYRFFKYFGYEVKVFVCCHQGKTDGGSIYWYQALRINNSIPKTTEFKYKVGDDVIKGYNMLLEPQDYIQKLREAMGMIWDEKPEFLFELGEETMLAGLCSHFTTMVTAGITKAPPVTTAPIVAQFFDYTSDESAAYASFLEEEQQVIDIRHYTDPRKGSVGGKAAYQKQDFGISKDSFVIVVAGNRLDEEITKGFWNIILEILEKSSRISFLFIGDCPKVKEKSAEESYGNRMFFSGMVQEFRETIAVGDLFLNPPRQGGGTGAALSILEEIPVITLDHCDVESSVGKAFVCKAVEEMPSLVSQYESDPKFMARQKKACRKRVAEKSGVDSVGNFQKLFHLVEAIARREDGTDEA